MEIRSQPPFGANEQSVCQGTEAKRWAFLRAKSQAALETIVNGRVLQRA